jgi:hypothetical protein
MLSFQIARAQGALDLRSLKPAMCDKFATQRKVVQCTARVGEQRHPAKGEQSILAGHTSAAPDCALRYMNRFKGKRESSKEVQCRAVVLDQIPAPGKGPSFARRSAGRFSPRPRMRLPRFISTP